MSWSDGREYFCGKLEAGYRIYLDTACIGWASSLDLKEVLKGVPKGAIDDEQIHVFNKRALAYCRRAQRDVELAWYRFFCDQVSTQTSATQGV